MLSHVISIFQGEHFIMQESISEIWEKYFKSKGAGYAYVLLNTDGRTRANLLGINKRHYVNSVAANS